MSADQVTVTAATKPTRERLLDRYSKDLSISADVFQLAVIDPIPVQLRCRDEEECIRYRNKAISEYLKQYPNSTILCLVDSTTDLKEIDARMDIQERFGKSVEFDGYANHGSNSCIKGYDRNYRDMLLLSGLGAYKFFVYNYMQVDWLRQPHIRSRLVKVVSIEQISWFTSFKLPTRVIQWDRGHTYSIDMQTPSMYDVQCLLLILTYNKIQESKHKKGEEYRAWLPVHLIQHMLCPMLCRIMNR